MLRPAGNAWRRDLSASIAACVFAALASVATFAAELAGESRVISGPGIDAGAGTLPGALVLAYQTNPQLNAQRAATRATDENVPTALAGYRPRVTGTSSLAEQYLDNTLKTIAPTGQLDAGAPIYTQNKNAAAQPIVGLTGTQTLFNGFQTGNRTRQAEGQVFAARETLRSTEETVLLNAATAYMNLLRDAAIRRGIALPPARSHVPT